MKNNNITNITDLHELFLLQIESSWFNDSLYLFLITPLAIFGTITNAICVLIFLKKEFKSINLFKYYLIYSLNSFAISTTMMLSFLLAHRYFFDLSISLLARVFSCLIFPSFVSILFFFGNILDIAVNLERASSLSVTYKKFSKISPYLVSFIGLVFSTLVEIPSMFMERVSTDQEINDAQYNYNKLKTFDTCPNTLIATPIFETSFIILEYTIKDVITLILVIGSNVSSFILFKKFFNKKKALIQSPVIENDSEKPSILNKNKETLMEQRLVIMTCTLTAVSFILLMFHLFVEVVHHFTHDTNIVVLIYIIVGFKQCVNIFFFYSFNSNFRKALKLL